MGSKSGFTNHGTDFAEHNFGKYNYKKVKKGILRYLENNEFLKSEFRVK